MSDSRDIFERMRSGEPIRFQDPEYYKVQEVVDRALRSPQASNALPPL